MTRASPLAAALLTLSAVASFRAGTARKLAAQEKPSTLRVQTNLVIVLTSVMDATGRAVLDLPQDSFQITEEGVPQRIERFEAGTSQPLDLALMIDTSGSTYKDLKFEREAAARFIQRVVRAEDRLGVFAFDENVTQLSSFTSDAARLEAGLRRIEGGAGTSLYDAIVLGAQALKRLPAGRRRALVLVTDAGETTSSSKFEDARRAAVTADALLYTIVLRTEYSENIRNTAGEHALETITDSSGGDLFYLHDITQLDQMFARIDRELRTQYLLGYYPHPVPPAGSFRRIEVSVKGSYVVRARKSYRAAEQP